MNRRSAPSLARLAGAATAGALLGHAITYMLVVPEAGARDALLASTGHGYWAAAVALAVILGLASAGAVAVRQFRGGIRGERTLGPEGIGRLAVGIALMQSLIFVLQETIERLDVHAPLVTLLNARLLVAGVVVQALVALAIAFVLFFIARAAAAAGRALRSAVRLRPGPLPHPALVAVPLRTALAAAGGIRAPPR